jgi:ASCH domain
MKGLIVREPYASQILSGEKTEEFRGRPTKIRERIAIIPAGSGTVAGTVHLEKCTGPHRRRGRYKDKTYIYLLKDPVKFKKPKPYKHPYGAVIWVNLD